MPGLLRSFIPKFNKSQVCSQIKVSKIVHVVMAPSVVIKLFGWCLVRNDRLASLRRPVKKYRRLTGGRTRELTYKKTLSDYSETITSIINCTKFKN